MRFDILSLFPEYFQGPFAVSILKRAIERKIIGIHHTDIRAFAKDKHKTVDDRPYGGGPGMVLMPEPVCSAIQSVKTKKSKTIYLSPQGTLLTDAKCRELAKEEHLLLLCGHYEGIDERIIESEIDEEISIGDYILTNGCISAIVLIDAIVRFIPGVLGHPDAAERDTFSNGLFSGPQYTRPQDFKGKTVPDVLMNGHHAEIERWRKQQGLAKTKQIRPDLFYKHYQKEIES